MYPIQSINRIYTPMTTNDTIKTIGIIIMLTNAGYLSMIPRKFGTIKKPVNPDFKITINITIGYFSNAKD